MIKFTPTTQDKKKKNHVRHVHSEKKYSKMTTKQQGTNIWNSILVHIRNLKTVNNYSRKLKNHFIKSY